MIEQWLEISRTHLGQEGLSQVLLLLAGALVASFVARWFLNILQRGAQRTASSMM